MVGSGYSREGRRGDLTLASGQEVGLVLELLQQVALYLLLLLPPPGHLQGTLDLSLVSRLVVSCASLEDCHMGGLVRLVRSVPRVGPLLCPYFLLLPYQHPFLFAVDIK